jgi:uncharacterized protein YcnI
VHAVDDSTAPLPDGTYDVFVVDASDVEATDGSLGTRLEVTLTVGEEKGRVLTVTSAAHLGGELDLLGMPATLTVASGVPSIAIDR